MLKPGFQQALYEVPGEVSAVSFGTALLRGIFAGWLTRFVAGSVEVLYLAMTGHQTWGSYFTGYMLPALIGNSMGGVSLVSALNQAQLIAGRSPVSMVHADSRTR